MFAGDNVGEGYVFVEGQTSKVPTVTATPIGERTSDHSFVKTTHELFKDGYAGVSEYGDEVTYSANVRPKKYAPDTIDTTKKTLPLLSPKKDFTWVSTLTEDGEVRYDYFLKNKTNTVAPSGCTVAPAGGKRRTRRRRRRRSTRRNKRRMSGRRRRRLTRRKR
jgi:hypothetical protein